MMNIEVRMEFPQMEGDERMGFPQMEENKADIAETERKEMCLTPEQVL